MHWFVTVLCTGAALAGCVVNTTTNVQETDSGQTTEAPDLNDPKVRFKKLLEVAIDSTKLRRLGSASLHYAPNSLRPYTGWVKNMHENGKVRGLGRYKDGKSDGLMTVWHENGKTWKEIHFKAGEKDGPWKLWYENGQKSEDGQFKGDKEDGLWTSWHENGQKWREQNWRDGERDGVTTYFTKTGSEDFRETYKDGIKLKD